MTSYCYLFLLYSFTTYCTQEPIRNMYLLTIAIYYRENTLLASTDVTLRHRWYKNLVAVITAVIGRKISSYEFIKWHRITLIYYAFTEKIWSVKSQFLNSFYAEMPLWSCRIFCKTVMEASILKYTHIPCLKPHERHACISHSVSVYHHFSAERDEGQRFPSILRKEICG